ncbi:MAG: hypothetical protein JWP25_3799 [Bradyrhizobium sp.]|jgi:hypothetical protein|nr:hypothetical protein [Bradyrhizobium sp.]
MDFALKDWQPLIASMVALSAAVLVYKSAMKKGNFDRQVRFEDIRGRILGIYLRAEHMCDVLAARAYALEEKTANG